MGDIKALLSRVQSDAIIAITALESVLQITSASCVSPPQVIGSRHDATQDSYATSAVIRYTCKSGFILEEPSHQRVCLQNGTWTGQDSPCQINASSLGYAIISCLITIIVFVVLIGWALNRHKRKESIAHRLSRSAPFGFTRARLGYKGFSNPVPESSPSIHSRESSLLELPLSTWEHSNQNGKEQSIQNVKEHNTQNGKPASTMVWTVSNGKAASTPSTVNWETNTENGRPASTVALNDVYPIDVTSL
ncbi:uncharacterized protein [Amphiura filiformis]|uniref:uncharacterized protein n=1 Tax=Amphiura filiformis TaxID=82378 RepID=UPI003B219A7B